MIDRQKLKNGILAVIATLFYFIGSLTITFVFYCLISGYLNKFVLFTLIPLLCFPIGIWLFTIVGKNYRPIILVVSLIVPPPLLTLGLYLTPGNLLPFMLALMSLISMIIMFILLNFWGCPNKSSKNDAVNGASS